MTIDAIENNTPSPTIVTHAGSLYDYTGGCYRGVLIKESTMRKLAKLQARHLEDVKRLLANEADRGRVFPSMWTLHNPQGVQTTVKYIDTSADAAQRIAAATTSSPPTHCPLVFIAGSMGEAKTMANARAARV